MVLLLLHFFTFFSVRKSRWRELDEADFYNSNICDATLVEVVGVGDGDGARQVRKIFGGSVLKAPLTIFTSRVGTFGN